MGCGRSQEAETDGVASDTSLSGFRLSIRRQAEAHAKARTRNEGTVLNHKFHIGWTGGRGAGKTVHKALTGLYGGKHGEHEEELPVDPNKEYQAKLQFLAMVPLMKKLPKKMHAAVASVCTTQEFEVGDTVIRQGDPGDAFYMIRKGEARVHMVDEEGNERWLSVLRACDYFGENALLHDAPRMASIVAETALHTFTIKREHFRDLGLSAKLQFMNRRAVVDSGRKATKAKEPTPKTPDEYRFIAKALKSNQNLEYLIDWADDRVKNLIDVMWSERVEEGQEVITKQDVQADYFYIVQEGLFEVLGEDDSGSGEIKRLMTIGPGGSFGELALLYHTPRSATVVCKERALVWLINRALFKQILMQVSAEQLQRYKEYLDEVPIFNSLSSADKEELAQGLSEMHFTKGENVLEEGGPGTSFYIMYDGTMQILKGGLELGKVTAVEGRSPQWFGEKALLEAEKRTATVKVVSEVAKVLCIDRETFETILGPLKDLIAANGHRPSSQQRRGSCSEPVAHAHSDHAHHEPIKQRDLKKVADMGFGEYSKVELWEHKATGKTYALKRVSRRHIVQEGRQEYILAEKEVLMSVESPFIVTLFETYASRKSLSFLMECLLGGDLQTVYSNKGFYGSQRHARYYTAGAILALDTLHEHRAIYRDLKPENMMLSDKGHMKLTDFGLAKFVVGKTYTSCGTPLYFAPEMIHSEGHNQAVDWWALGILIFEFMTGYTPFADTSPMLIYNKVIKGIDVVKFPAECSGQCARLVCALLRPNPSERLPMRKGGVDKLKEHEWYKGFNWEEMEDPLTTRPPYHPVVTDKKDLHHFSVDPAGPQRQALDHFVEVRDDGDWDKGFATQ